MKKYIAICEKSSIMENLAEALPEKLVKRGRNYYGEHYQIHALSGHIFELFNMEDYPEYPSKKKGWDLDGKYEEARQREIPEGRVRKKYLMIS